MPQPKPGAPDTGTILRRLGPSEPHSARLLHDQLWLGGIIGASDKNGSSGGGNSRPTSFEYAGLYQLPDTDKALHGVLLAMLVAPTPALIAREGIIGFREPKQVLLSGNFYIAQVPPLR